MRVGAICLWRCSFHGGRHAPHGASVLCASLRSQAEGSASRSEAKADRPQFSCSGGGHAAPRPPAVGDEVRTAQVSSPWYFCSHAVNDYIFDLKLLMSEWIH